MEHMSIEPGTRLLAHTALDEWVPLTAVSKPQQGQDFDVVWVCEDWEWDPAGPPAQGLIPWPVVEVTTRND